MAAYLYLVFSTMMSSLILQVILLIALNFEKKYLQSDHLNMFSCLLFAGSMDTRGLAMTGLLPQAAQTPPHFIA